jgi:hypothetical protein
VHGLAPEGAHCASMDHGGRRKKTMFQCAIECAPGGTHRESSSAGLRFKNRFCEPAAADSFAIHSDVSFVELSTNDEDLA